MLKRKWKWILAVVVVAIFAALPFIVRPPERRLLVLGTKVVSTKGWLNDKQGFNYQWLPGNRIFAWRSLPQGKCEPMEIDAVTGREIPLPGFHRRFPLPHSLPSGWQVSPDGKWILLSEYEAPMTWTAVALDGSQVIRWQIHGEISSNGPVGDETDNNGNTSLGIWRPDSRSWVEIGRRKGVLHSYIYHLTAPAVIQDMAVQETKGGSILCLSDAVTMHDVTVITLDVK